MADWPRGGAGAPDAGEPSGRRGAEPRKQQRGDAGDASVHAGRSACLHISDESRAAARGESGGERSRVAEAPAYASVRGCPTPTDQA